LIRQQCPAADIFDAIHDISVKFIYNEPASNNDLTKIDIQGAFGSSVLADLLAEMLANLWAASSLYDMTQIDICIEQIRELDEFGLRL